MATEDLCVCCGMPVPEGRHVCPACENKLWRGDMCNAVIRTVDNECIYKNGTREEISEWLKTMANPNVAEIQIKKI